MDKFKSPKRHLFLITLVVLLFVLPALALAQDGDGEEEEILAHCNPVASRLAETMLVDCDDLLALLAKGYGLGQVMQAVYLADGQGDLDEVETLIQQKQEQDIGWGQLKMAKRLAGEDGDAEEMLRLKQEEGLGWGQIKKIEDLVDAGAGYQQAIDWLKEGVGWDEIQETLGIDGGPPPWAASGKDKTDKEVGNGRSNGNGPPAWSNAGGNDKSDQDDDGD